MKRSACLAWMILKTSIFVKANSHFTAHLNHLILEMNFQTVSTMLNMILIHYVLICITITVARSDETFAFVLYWFIWDSLLLLNWPNHRLFWGCVWHFNIRMAFHISTTALLELESQMAGIYTPGRIHCVYLWRYFVRKSAFITDLQVFGIRS